MKGTNKSENDQSISHKLAQPTANTLTGDAALEFIKHVCAVLALDQNVQHDILVILFPHILTLLLIVASVTCAEIWF